MPAEIPTKTKFNSGIYLMCQSTFTKGKKKRCSCIIQLRNLSCFILTERNILATKKFNQIEKLEFEISNLQNNIYSTNSIKNQKYNRGDIRNNMLLKII